MSLSTRPEQEQPGISDQKLTKQSDGGINCLLKTLTTSEGLSRSFHHVATAVQKILYEYFRRVGSFFLVFLHGVRHRSILFYQKHLQRHFHKADLLFLRVRKWFSKRGQGVLFHFYHFLKFFVDAYCVVRNGFRSHPTKLLPLRCCYAVAAFGRGVRNNAGLFVRALNYALPALAIVAFINLVSYITTLNFAVSIEYNGELVAYVPNETVYEEAESKLQERLLYQEGDEVFTTLPTFALTIVSPNEVTTEPTKLTDTIIRSSSADMVEAVGIQIDGEFIGAVKNINSINATLDAMLSKYKTNTEGETVSFLKDIQTESGLFLQKNVTSEKSIIDRLNSRTEQDVYYTAIAGDSPSGIASDHDMSTAELVALNPNILTELKIGQQVLVNKSQPYLPVKTTRQETYTVSVPFETVYVDSKDLYQGQKKTLTEGAKGKSSYTDEVSYVDGVEVDRMNMSISVISEPVEQRIAKGTKVMPKVSTYSGPQSDLGFIRPVSSRSAYVSQRYTGQYGHTGIDIAFRGNGYGTPIVATLPGTVEYSGWRGTYGNLVIINHGGGLKTYYAHCSKLTVSAGQTVSQGQQIANVGSTGRSTGNHCHYMVVVNGSYKNPLNYIPGY